jgi:hypothetical protein
MNSRTAAEEITIAALVFIDIGLIFFGEEIAPATSGYRNIISSFDAGFRLFAPKNDLP